MDFAPLIESGRIDLRQVDPAELSPGEFAHAVRVAADDEHSRVIVIDSLNGYLNAMPSEQYLTLHLHELLSYLGQTDVTTLLTMTQHGIVASDAAAPVDASYLADTVLLLRYFEAAGEIRQALSVIKKRTGRHERSDSRTAVHCQWPDYRRCRCRNFEGVLTGTPRMTNPADDVASAS